MRAVALIDGEHYAPVVRDALRALPVRVGRRDPGRRHREAARRRRLRRAARRRLRRRGGRRRLSDEPVLGPAERMRWASRALAAGLPYVGADFRFDPPVLEPFELPSIAVIGTGKRVGKTAVTAHLARLLARDRNVVVVAMGRGGPPEPEVVEIARRRSTSSSSVRARGTARGVRPPRDRRALRRADDRLPACGRRAWPARCSSRTSRQAPRSPLSVARRRRLRRQRRCDPAGRRRSPNSRRRPRPIRRRLPEHLPAADLRRRDRGLSSCASGAARALDGRVAVFTAGGSDVSHLDADVVHVSTNLANRDARARDLVAADTYLVELKAAAIDVVVEHALATA